MAAPDVFLKVQGVTGDANDVDHKGEIDVMSWTWGVEGSKSAAPGKAGGKPAITELYVRKRVDTGSATLMSFLYNHKLISQAKLTVRKAGGPKSLEYLKIEMENVRVLSVTLNMQSDVEIDESVRLGFTKVRVSYTPQGASGAAGGGTGVFEAEVYPGE